MKIKLTHHDNAAYTSFHLPQFSCCTLCYEVTALQVPLPAQLGARVQFPARSGTFPICHMLRPILGVSQPPIQSPGIHNSFPRKRIGLNLTTHLYLQMHFYSCKQCFVGWFPNSHKLFLFESNTISFDINMWLPGCKSMTSYQIQIYVCLSWGRRNGDGRLVTVNLSQVYAWNFHTDTVFDQPVCQIMWPSSSQIVLSSLTVWCIALMTLHSAVFLWHHFQHWNSDHLFNVQTISNACMSFL
jgi:hypothetical protein